MAVAPTGLNFGTPRGISGGETYPIDIDDQVLYFFVDDAQSIGTHILDDHFTNDSL